jgi:hypothetical protein
MVVIIVIIIYLRWTFILAVRIFKKLLNRRVLKNYKIKSYF